VTRSSWLLALAITTGLVFFAARQQSPSVVEAEPIAVKRQSTDSQVARSDTRAPIRPLTVNPFRARGALAPTSSPPPAITPVSETPRAAAPSIPFRFLARVTGVDGKQSIYLASESGVFAVVEGELLDDRYRVDKVDAEVLTLTYLPLDERQTVPMR